MKKKLFYLNPENTIHWGLNHYQLRPQSVRTAVRLEWSWVLVYHAVGVLPSIGEKLCLLLLKLQLGLPFLQGPSIAGFPVPHWCHHQILLRKSTGERTFKIRGSRLLLPSTQLPQPLYTHGRVLSPQRDVKRFLLLRVLYLSTCNPVSTPSHFNTNTMKSKCKASTPAACIGLERSQSQ